MPHPPPPHWTLSTFRELTTTTLYDLLALRQEIFIVEQGCHYLDADGVDRDALHLIGHDPNGAICAYLRTFPDPLHTQTARWRIGRVLVHRDHRRQGIGEALMREALRQLSMRGIEEVELHAQSYLKTFYERLGFETTGEEFIEAGIPHIPMERTRERTRAEPTQAPPQHIKHILFDLDGTLIDSSYDYAACFEQLALEWHHPPPSKERIRALMSAGLNPQLNETLGPLEGEPRERALARFREICLAHPLTHTQLYPGAHALLDTLRAHGYSLSVCTNRPQDLCEQVLQSLGLRQYFHHVVGGDNGFERKPAPDMLQHTLSLLSLRPAEALMVGDSEVDIEAARAAGVACAAVMWGYTSRDALWAAGPAWILAHPHDLVVVLMNQ